MASQEHGLQSHGVEQTGEPAVRVRGLGKTHRIYERPQDRLKQMLLSRLGWSWGHDFWALRQVSFEVQRGERLGIIGKNGSGKSTLLQLIAGTLAPSEGEVLVGGRVSALLELGTGFNPDFSGRENAIMNGSILGIPPSEMEARVDQIAAFAEIGEFFDQPVKLYSSGMFVRLAFAVATNVDADIVLIDEALAVGDVFFQQKCFRRLEALRESGVTVLLVSHSMPDIEQLCRRAILLDRGEIVFLGPAPEAVRQYYLLDQAARPAEVGEGSTAESQAESVLEHEGDGLTWPSAEAFLDLSGLTQTSNGWARCTGVALCDERGQRAQAFRQGQTASFFYEFELLRNVEVPIGGLNIYNSRAVLAHGRNTLQYDCSVPVAVARGDLVRFRQDVRLDLGLDEYTFEVGLATISREHFERRSRYREDVLHSHIVRVCHLATAGRFAVVPPHDAPRFRARFYGVVDLPGRCQVATARAR
jgi:lipopolysaccharide transport system ATP-binding protein